MQGQSFSVGITANYKGLLIFLSFLSVILLAGCSEINDSFLDPKGPIAAAQKEHFITIALVSMLAAVPVFLLVPLILWRYRYTNKRARYTPDWEYSGLLDSVMWGVPFVIVFVLSTQLWHSTKALDPYKPIESDLQTLQVRVVGLDWKWLFIYPQYGVASIGELAFPVDRPVALKLTSDTVMQSFMISALAGQIYTMPGMQTQLHIKADAAGVFEGENTQFNGIGFAEQKFNAVALAEADFDKWIQTARTNGVSLNQQTYDFLGNPSTVEQVAATLGSARMPRNVIYFKDVSPGLYNSIVARYHTGEAIPMTSQPGGTRYRRNLVAPPLQPAARSSEETGVTP